MIFGVEFRMKTAEDVGILDNFLTEFAYRLKNTDFMKNPFLDTKLYRNLRVEKDRSVSEWTVVRLIPGYPPIYWLGFLFILFGAILAYFAPSWSLVGFIPGFLLSSVFLLFTRLPSLVALWYRLRRDGYKGSIRPLSNNDLLKKLVEVVK